MTTKKTLSGLGFTDTFDIEGRASIADLFKPNKRCGIYILHTSNGEHYAGQAIDVTRRYVQHCKNHNDIVKISFKRMPQKKLNQEEQKVIHTLEHEGLLLRNIAYTSIPHGASDFDLVMPVKEQKIWLKNLDIVGDKYKRRIVSEDLRRKYRGRLDSFMKQEYANQAVELLRSYVQLCIPAARRGEVSFWAVSCLPQKNVYSRINIYWQEVLQVFVDKKELWLSFHLAKSPFEKLSDKKYNKLYEKYSSLGFFLDQIYEKGGSDQTRIEINANEFNEFIKDPNILYPIRLFNYRLMKKGPCNWGKNHCLDLADKLV
jgi:hypothetical protein